MFERWALVHCLSSTITAESEPVLALLPVIRTSRRFEESGSFSSTRIPWSRRIGELERVRHRAERVVPGRDLARRRLVPELLEEPLRQLVRERRAHGIADELLGRAPVEMQVAPALRRSIGTVVKW